MEKGEFMVWVEDAVAERDTAIREIDTAAGVAVKTFIIGRLKEKLNDH